MEETIAFGDFGEWTWWSYLWKAVKSSCSVAS